MAYQRKTIDRWDIETNYGYGWGVECSEYTKQMARENFRLYVEESFGRYAVRLRKRREEIVIGGLLA